MERIVIYTDGGARGNPGPAGAFRHREGQGHLEDGRAVGEPIVPVLQVHLAESPEPDATHRGNQPWVQAGSGGVGFGHAGLPHPASIEGNAPPAPDAPGPARWGDRRSQVP